MVNRKDFRPNDSSSTISDKDRETIRSNRPYVKIKNGYGDYTYEPYDKVVDSDGNSAVSVERNAIGNPVLYDKSGKDAYMKNVPEQKSSRDYSKEYAGESNPNVSDDTVREINLTMDNEEPVYRHEQEIYKNYDKKHKRGVYDREKAKQGFLNLSVIPFCRKYEKEWHVKTTKAEREAIAEERTQAYEQYRKDEHLD